MGFVILALFVAVPLAEIWLFIEVGGRIGGLATIGLIVLTAATGLALLRQQGLATMRRAQESMNRGEFPMASAFDGVCLAIAGILLLTPGFFTDTIGFLLMVPPLRRALGLWLARHIRPVQGVSGSPGGGAHWQWQTETRWRAPEAGRGQPRGDGVIEGEFEDVTPQDPSQTIAGKDGKGNGD